MAFENTQFVALSEGDLRTAFIGAANGRVQHAERFFEKFKYVYDVHSDPLGSFNQCTDLLQRCWEIDSELFAKIHKGTPYYWMAMTAFMSHNFETAVFFFDAAVSEDLRAGIDPRAEKTTPSLKFILIESKSDEQAAKRLVEKADESISLLISDYNARPGCKTQLSIPDLRSRFLIPAVSPGGEKLRSLAAAFISLNLEFWFLSRMLRLRPVKGSFEMFFLHLFKGCVLFESLLKENPTSSPKEETLGKVLTELSKINPDMPDGVGIGGASFESIVADIVGTDSSLTSAVKTTGKIRNTLGHKLSWDISLSEKQHQHLFRAVGLASLHAIACFYPLPEAKSVE